MSFNVLIVPEDPTNKGYILDPLIECMLAECGKSRVKVEVLRNPRTQGYEHAKAVLANELLYRYRHKNLLLFLPDADGSDRSDEFQNLEQMARDAGVRLLCCAAREEVEVWLLAGHLDKFPAQSWKAIRADRSLKENFFGEFLKKYGDTRRAGAGRDSLIKETLQNYPALLRRCPELAELERRIKSVLLEG